MRERLGADNLAGVLQSSAGWEVPMSTQDSLTARVLPLALGTTRIHWTITEAWTDEAVASSQTQSSTSWGGNHPLTRRL